MTMGTTNRREFLKTGALAAAPLAAAAPVAVLADDGSRAKLARLEDERAIEALHRAFLRSEETRSLAEGLRAISEDPAADGTLELAEDGRRAHLRRPVRVELETEFTGHSTLERMARFQGQGSHRRSEQRVLATDYVKGQDGWRMAGQRLA
jgi:hypothetical protein